MNTAINRITVLVVLLITFGQPVFSQDEKPKKLYLETLGGYGFPLVNDELGSTNEVIGIVDRLVRADSSISIKPVQGTQGPGWQFGFGIGYMFHPNIGVEIQGTYLKSNPILLARNNSPTLQAEHTVVGERFDLIPQLVLNFPFKEKWSLYSKTGLVIPVWGRSSSEIRVEDQGGLIAEEIIGIPNPDTHASLKVSAATFGKFSYGFQTRLGVGYKVLDWMHVFTELKFMALSIRSKEDKINDLEIFLFNDNTGRTFTVTEADLDKIDTHTVYVNELTENSNNPLLNSNADPNQPLEELAKKDNFNQLAVSIGLRFFIK